MKVLQRVEQRRRLMIMGLAKAELLKGDYHKLLTRLGYDRTKKSLDPTRFRPPTDNTLGFVQKWVQVALNVVLGLKLTIDGSIGPITRQAIKRFQRREGLVAHGYIDDRTLQVLELRTGFRAPRHAEHEAVPYLLSIPRRGIWRPERGKGRRKGRDARVPDGRGREDRTGAAPEGAEIADPDADVEVEPATPGLLQTEAMQAVVASAFSEDFAAEVAREVGTSRAGIRRAFDAFVDRHRGAEPPDWLTRSRDLARAHPEMAAGILRRQWWNSRDDD